MIKRIGIFLFSLALVVYLGFALTAFNKRPVDKPCTALLFSVTDSVDYGFIHTKEVEDLLKKQHLYPVGKPRKHVNVERIEKALHRHPFIQQAECYLTSGDKLCIEVHQRIPLLHVLTDDGGDYYIDNTGKQMSLHDKAADVPVATGQFSPSFACKQLYELARYLDRNRFWDAQIEQIHVTPKHEIVLVPRVGDHLLFLGETDHLSEKFDKLFMFYRQGLNQVGWNKYDTISIEFLNQIICTKKDKKI